MSPRMLKCRAIQVVMVPESVATSVLIDELVELVSDDLRLHRLVPARAALDQQLIPLFHAALRGIEE